MKLPGLDQIVVPREKIVDYLLSPTHVVGRHKAKWLSKFGFSASSWQALAEALKKHANANELARVEESPFGKRYIIEGELDTPMGPCHIRSVWFIETIEQEPRFVTAYPLRRKRK